MKIFWLVIASAGLGIVIGVGTSWARGGWNSPPPQLTWYSDEPVKPGEPASSNEAPPKVVVDADEFDFGRVAYGQSAEHTFHFSNEGQGPLKLESGGTSCNRCTLSKVPTEPIPPGETADVVVVFHAATEDADFRQSATIITNDPETPRVELTVTGRVVVPAKVNPPKVVLSRVSPTETRTAKVRVIAAFDPDFAINSFELTDPETAPFFDVAIEPMSPSDVEAAAAKRGYEITMTIKPGMPLGPLRQGLTLHTTLADQAELYIPIEGSVDSDVSIAGGSFDRDTGVLAFGAVSQRTGAERKLLVLIRGEHRHEVHVSVDHCEPPLLQATLGEPSELNAGAVVQIPLVVKIPPGSPLSNHLLDYGKIFLDTDHPAAKQIRIRVQFAVED